MCTVSMLFNILFFFVIFVICFYFLYNKYMRCIEDDLELQDRMTYVRKHFGSRLKYLIKFRGYKVAPFAKELGWSKDTLYKYFRGEIFPKKEYLDLLLDKLSLNLNVFMYDTFLLDKKWMYWNSDDSELIEDIDFNGVNGVKFGVVDELEELNIMLDFIRQNAASLKSEDLHNILYLVRKANDYIFKIYTENTDWELLDSGDSK